MMIKYVKELFDFIEESPTPFHNVRLVKTILTNLKYKELKENEEWVLEENQGYYVSRNNGSIICFKVGDTPNKFNVTASHNDSPCFKLKPNFDFEKGAYVTLNTEVYGGPILSTWFDRPLGVAGRIFVRNANCEIEERLVNLSGHTFIIPSLAPHLSRGDANAPINPQVDTLPLISLSKDEFKLEDQLNNVFVYEGEKLLGHDLFIYNKEEKNVIGLKNDMIASPKLDDLECVFGTLEAFLEAKPNNSINVCTIFNHEEVGSGSNHGAASTFLPDTLERICESLGLNKYIMYANSMFVSADNAHAFHYAAPGKADPTNAVFMNEGIVIKSNSSLSYTTDGGSFAEFANILENANVKYQSYTNPSNVRGGGTLGRIALEKLSIKILDIGLAQLAMHSCYETAGAYDIEYLVRGIKAFFER